MKWQRCSTFTPGHWVSTTKALIFRVWGSIAITTSSFASVPFVVQSLVPFRTKLWPSGVLYGGGRDPRGVGTHLGLGEREGGDLALRAARQVSRFCCSLPNTRSGAGSPIDWCAEEQRGEVAAVAGRRAAS